MNKQINIFGIPMIKIIRKTLYFHNNRAGKRKGFSLIEALLAMFLMSVALMGLAQLFVFSILNNNRSDQMTNATFLARQSIEQMRNLLADELSAMSASPIDEYLNIDGDSTIDFRRITVVEPVGVSWSIRVLVFPGGQTNLTADELRANPSDHKVRADITTKVNR